MNLNVLVIVIVIVAAVAVVTVAMWLIFGRRKKASDGDMTTNGQTADLMGRPTLGASDGQKVISIKASTWYMCTDDIRPYEAGIVYLGADIDPAIKNWFRYFREATKEEIEAQHPSPTPEPAPEPEPTPEPEPEPEVDYTVLDAVVDKFASVIRVAKDSQTYGYLAEVYREAYWQYHDAGMASLQTLYTEANFPLLYGSAMNAVCHAAKDYDERLTIEH